VVPWDLLVLGLACAVLWAAQAPPGFGGPVATPGGGLPARELDFASRLPVFELDIPTASLSALSAVLPAGFEEGHSTFAGVDAPKWPWVPATIRHAGRTWEVKLRFRGWHYDHYMLRKKSWRVRFPRENPFYGMRELNLVNPRQRSIVWSLVEHDMLRDLGQLVADQYLAHVRINGDYVGLHIAFEQPDGTFLERHDRPVGELYGETQHTLDPFASLKNWQKYASLTEDFDLSPLDRLLRGLAGGGDEPLRDLLAVDRWLDFYAQAAVTGSTNPGSHNWRLYLNPYLLRYELLPWYQFGVEMPYSADYLDVAENRPLGFVFGTPQAKLYRDPELYRLFLGKVARLLAGQGHPAVVVARINEWRDRVRPDVYADRNKHTITHFTFESHYVSNPEWEQAVEALKAAALTRATAHWAELSAHELELSVEREAGSARLEATASSVAPLELSAVRLTWTGDAPLSVGLRGGAQAVEVDAEGSWLELDPPLTLVSGFREDPRGDESHGEPTWPNWVPQPAPVRGTLALTLGPETDGELRVEGARVENTLTQGLTPAPRESTAALSVWELPLGIALDTPPADRSGLRLGLWTAAQRPLRVERLTFACDASAAVRVRSEPRGRLGATLGEGRWKRGQVEVELAEPLEVAGRPDPFLQEQGRPLAECPWVPWLTELRVESSGAPPRLIAVGARTHDGAPIHVEVRAAPALRVPIRHSQPRIAPVPAGPGLAPHLPPRPLTREVRWAGVVRVSETVDLGPEVSLQLAPGTRVELGPGVSVRVRGQLHALGTPAEPIAFVRADPTRAWGALALASDTGRVHRLEHCRIEGGLQGRVGGVDYTGALSIYGGGVRMVACTIRDNSGDDGVNCKSCEPLEIRDCTFSGNQDALDLDWCDGVVVACGFTGNGGDALDLSGAGTLVRDTWIHGTADKGVSVGERSRPRLENVSISDCEIGIAVKDDSSARIVRASLCGNRAGLSLYTKKRHFGGARAELVDSLVWGNERGVYVDAGSAVTLRRVALQSSPRSPGELSELDPVESPAPEFSDLTSGDLRLRSRSPLAQAGVGATVEPKRP